MREGEDAEIEVSMRSASSVISIVDMQSGGKRCVLDREQRRLRRIEYWKTSNEMLVSSPLPSPPTPGPRAVVSVTSELLTIVYPKLTTMAMSCST